MSQSSSNEYERIGASTILLERIAVPVALGQQVLGVQAPLSPLPRHAAGKVAHHAQRLAGEVAEERRAGR